MANLGNLIVRGVTRILGDAYANKFIGNLQGNADTATSAIKASTADSATNATSANKAAIATAVQDYGTSDYREIKIGYNGSGLSSSTIETAVGFTDSGTKIKDISKDEFRNWLATASGIWPITVSNSYNSTNADYANFLNVNYGNEFRFGNISSDQTVLWFNYANPDGTQNNISTYLFGDGKRGTNSTIEAAQFTGNAATATKLQTARTIWGQSFDGTGNVSGAMTGVTDITASGVIYSNKYNNSGNASVAAFIINKDGDYFGIGTSLGSVSNVGFGLTANIYGTWKRELMTITNDGNVGICTTSPSYKLHVAGDIYTTTGFKKEGSSDSYVLLGGGGHKVVSDFATSSEVVTSLGTSGNYLTWTKNGSTNNITVPYATNTDTVDGYHISDNYNLPYKNITNLTCTPSSIAGDYWYVKILIQYSYQGIVNQKMYLIASYSNLMTKAELQVYGYYLGYKYTASWYNEDTITGIASTRQDASQVIWLRMKKPIQYEGVIPDGSISIYSNYIASAEVITSAPSGVIFTDTLQSDGQHILSGDIKAESFKKNGSDDNYVLLGGGGHKAISDFATTSWVNDNFYTYSESDNRYIQSETDPIWTADKVNYYTKTECNNKFQLKGEYLTEQNLQGYATTTWVNSNYYTCLESDSRYIQSETDPVWTAAKGNYYTKNECNNRYIQSETDPVWTAAKSNYYTKTECDNRYQPKGTYLTEQNLQGYATQEWVRGEEYLYRSGGTMDARAEIGITTKLFIGNSTSSDTCYTKFNCILHGGGDESNPNWVIRDNGYAEFKSSVSANAFYASSDIRLKNILDDINIDFDKLKLIPKKYYTWKGSDILQLGTIAQDIQKIYPEVVSKNENGYLSVDYSKLSIIALAAIDKLNERIKELECQIKL